LAAVRITPPSSLNADVAIASATRALGLELSNADKGVFLSCFVDRPSLTTVKLLSQALYRRSLALSIKKDDDDAEKDLAEAAQLVPEDQAIAAELAKIRQRKKEKRDKEKKAYKKMFG